MAHEQKSIQLLDEILKLNGSALLDRVTLELHQQFQSYCTCVVEIAHLQHCAVTLSNSSGGTIADSMCYGLTGTPCEQVAQDIGELIFYQDEVYKLFPEDQMFQDLGIQAY
ncbi:MAG: diguanylate cyclase, partial [Pseudomonadota bacterium]